jgi:hypothetical protein
LCRRCLLLFRPFAATVRSSRKFVIRSIPISVAGGQCETKQRSVCHGREEAYYFGAGHECLYSLQHKAYDNNLVKDSSWKEIAEELHAQDKELSRRHGTVGEWQGNGRETARERQGNGMVCVNRP